ncbi:MAG: glycoside hydrolase family 2 TIM barrel-domain containing protein [Bacteroidia bacterium]|nr:glycoside hydrolase family 2 TIM barrel-domain containing protein [Bacteroidia bacterium]
MKRLASFAIFCLLVFAAFSQNIPLPEHPRPDYERPLWMNLNGAWGFAFDSTGTGEEKGWQKGQTVFPLAISVPFPWGSELSGVADKADIGWYQREVKIPDAWRGKKIFLTIGASDWLTKVWLDGQLLGEHTGGYTPFSFELTPYIRWGQTQKLVVMADDARRGFTLYGKQGYGNARGIWQTTYLEARGNDWLDALHFTPDIDNQKVKVTAWLPYDAPRDLSLTVNIPHASPPVSQKVTIPKGSFKYSFDVNLPNPHLWSLDDPFLYEVEAQMEDDLLHTYFGMRKISVVNLPGSEYPYVALNNQPLYLQLTLDQSYHPEGFYTFPSDDFMREEIERSKAIGLNGIRTHIKADIPRKLYWADKLGLLVMADLPNSWGEPDEKMQGEAEYTLREMIRRDYNHPAIFSWIVFNETWGLRTSVEENGKKRNAYLPTTQQWVASMYYLTKSLDPTRLVEDNSICCGAGHTETDINSWHSYLPGWEWEPFMKNLAEKTFEGSTYDFEPGFRQGKQPNINSECGNVWGYEGSTGDVDWSWDYHRMMNTFRRYPFMAGWLYTEHHDVINEWNGYWRFDRTEKETGLGEIVNGMTVNDFHSLIYLSTGNEISRTVKGGETVSVPLFISDMTGKDYGYSLDIEWNLTLTDATGTEENKNSGRLSFDYHPWIQEELSPLNITLPDKAGLAKLSLVLKDRTGKTLHHNFMFFEILSEKKPELMAIVEKKPADFASAQWSKRQWNVLEGKKVNGAGKGFFEYVFDMPADSRPPKAVYFVAELSAKELFVKDQSEFNRDQDYMLGARVAPSSNPNSYPMTDETFFPSEIQVLINGEKVKTTLLADDPADHRGVLSWHHQLQDKKLREAGSYGYLVKVPVPKKMWKNRTFRIRLETTGEGGIAVYGKEFGRYPLDPSLIVSY